MITCGTEWQGSKNGDSKVACYAVIKDICASKKEEVSGQLSHAQVLLFELLVWVARAFDLIAPASSPNKSLDVLDS